MSSVEDRKQGKKRRQPLTPWELPMLLKPVHRWRRSKHRPTEERPHFLPILAFVYRNRFAVASQIQRRFATILKSDRTARRHLVEMEGLGYLGVVETTAVGPLWPKVYFVTGRGARRLCKSIGERPARTSVSVVDRRRSEGFSAEQVVHEILTTEFLLAAWETFNSRPDLELLTIQRRSLVRHAAFRLKLDGRRTRLVPDAMFVYRQADQGMMACFVEMDMGTMNRKQLTAKFRRYASWAASKAGQLYLIELYRRHGAKAPRPVFRTLVIARDRSGRQDNHRLHTIAKSARLVMGGQPERLWLTTAAEMAKAGEDRLASLRWCVGTDRISFGSLSLFRT